MRACPNKWTCVMSVPTPSTTVFNSLPIFPLSIPSTSFSSFFLFFINFVLFAQLPTVEEKPIIFVSLGLAFTYQEPLVPSVSCEGQNFILLCD